MSNPRTCPFCNLSGSICHSSLYDAYYCSNCEQWLEPKCSDKECTYCNDRPDKPPLKEDSKLAQKL